MSDKPTVKQPIDDLIAEYKAEHLRCNGCPVEIVVKGAWMYITGKSGYTHTYKRNELPQFIKRLKARKSFVTDEQVEASNTVKAMDAKYKDDDRIYYFGWTIGGGHVVFGFHGTEAQFEAHCLLHPEPAGRNITEKRFCCTGKEQKAFTRLSVRDVLEKAGMTPPKLTEDVHA